MVWQVGPDKSPKFSLSSHQTELICLYAKNGFSSPLPPACRPPTKCFFYDPVWGNTVSFHHCAIFVAERWSRCCYPWWRSGLHCWCLRSGASDVRTIWWWVQPWGGQGWCKSTAFILKSRKQLWCCIPAVLRSVDALDTTLKASWSISELDSVWDFMFLLSNIIFFLPTDGSLCGRPEEQPGNYSQQRSRK